MPGEEKRIIELAIAISQTTNQLIYEETLLNSFLDGHL